MNTVPAEGAYSALSPSYSAQALTEPMLQSEEVMRQILAETIDSAESGTMRESGRTACGSGMAVAGPLGRFPKSVSLPQCPVDQAAGIWHSHVSVSELQNPEHSLPDWANVVFGEVDTSVVVGTQSSEVVQAAEDREAMIAAFQNALGREVNRTEDVVHALFTGDIRAPAEARSRVKSALSPLVIRVTTNYPDLDQRVATLNLSAIPAHAPQHAPGMCACSTFDETVTTDVAGLRRQAREGGDLLMKITRPLTREAKDAALGVVAGNILSALIGL